MSDVPQPVLFRIGKLIKSDDWGGGFDVVLAPELRADIEQLPGVEYVSGAGGTDCYTIHIHARYDAQEVYDYVVAHIERAAHQIGSVPATPASSESAQS